MKVPFSEITKEGIRKTLRDSVWASRSGVILIEKPRVEMEIALIDDVTATLVGYLKTAVSSVCSRCGCSLEYRVDAEYTYMFRLGEDSSVLEREFEYNDEDCNTVYLEEPVIEINEVIEEQLILSIPEKLLCSDDCKGRCQNCGANLNEEKCNCKDDNINSPFAVLKNLKK